jgi:hypothetical protein
MNSINLDDVGTIVAIIISLATLAGLLISYGRLRGKQEQAMNEMVKRLCEAEGKIETQYSDRNKINLAIEGLQKTFETEMSWIRETFRDIKSALDKLREKGI